MFLGTPNFSIISIDFGKAASELEVVNANKIWSFNAPISFQNGTLTIEHTPCKTKPINIASAAYKQKITLP